MARGESLANFRLEFSVRNFLFGSAPLRARPRRCNVRSDRCVRPCESQKCQRELQNAPKIANAKRFDAIEWNYPTRIDVLQPFNHIRLAIRRAGANRTPDKHIPFAVRASETLPIDLLGCNRYFP